MYILNITGRNFSQIFEISADNDNDARMKASDQMVDVTEGFR
jgi:hypothetical protein